MSQIVSFQKFYESIKNTKLPLKTAYKLSKLAAKINSELSFYQQKYSEIISEYGKRDENGNYIYSPDLNSIEIVEGRQEECLQKIKELQNLEVDINEINFSISELDGLNLTVSEMDCLLPFVLE